MTSGESARRRKRNDDEDDDTDEDRRPEDLLLTTAQVAKMLHVSTKRVLILIQTGRLKAHRLPGTRQYLFWRHEIVDLINASVVGPEDVESASETGVSGER